MQKIKGTEVPFFMPYADLHCDTLTACNGDLTNFSGQVNLEKLVKAHCKMQCFAVFTRGENALEKYKNAVLVFNKNEPYFKYTTPFLTVENLEFLQGEEGVSMLKNDGVRMASLVWNEKNKLAFPCGESGGLTALGKRVTERLNSENIILDISHLSEKGSKEAFEICTLPVVASHSNAYLVCPHKRNLTDFQIRKIADSGGVVGVNFFPDLLGGEPFVSAKDHVLHLINIGGENVVSIGSDFDGVPYFNGFEDCLSVPKFLEYLQAFLPYKVLEKFAYKNVERVFLP